VRRLFVPLIAMALLAAGPVAAQDPLDEVVGRAVRAALLGNAEGVRTEARLRRDAERQEKTRGGKPEKLAENIESLAIATERPVPTLGEARNALGDYGSDQLTRNLDRLIRREEPRQRYLESRKDRRYDDTRRAFNGVVVPVANAVQGQLFALITLPFEALDWLTVGRRFLTPEQRREAIHARAAAVFPSPDPAAESARDTIKAAEAKRIRTVALQARANGKRALEQRRYSTAVFWLARELELRGGNATMSAAHAEASALANREEADRVASLSVADGDAMFASAPEFAGATRVLRMLLAEDRAKFDGAARDFLADFSLSSANDDVRGAMAASARLGGEPALARVIVEEVAASREESPWRARARAALARPAFDPAAPLRAAQDSIDSRFNRYIFLGRDPDTDQRSQTPEEARLGRRFWIYRLQGLFLTDTLSRILFLPFTDPFPKGELLDAAARTPPGFFDSEQGRPWLSRVLEAQVDERRYADARATARRLGDPGRALAVDRKAARRLERLGKDAPSPRESVLIYRRLLNAYPEWPSAPRVEKRLAEASVAAETITVIEVEELKRYPALWRDRGLYLNPELLDGNKSNGEIGGRGVAVLRQNAYTYIRSDTRLRVEVPMEAADQKEVLRALEPLRRSGEIREELAKPMTRRNIPIALEAGVLPGFDIGPSMVPLDLDERQRSLYE